MSRAPPLGTQIWVWPLLDDPSLLSTARLRLGAALVVSAGPISLSEIGQKARAGEWPQMAAQLDRRSGLRQPSS